MLDFGTNSTGTYVMDPFSRMYREVQDKENTNLYKTKNDILVLSCVLHRLNKTGIKHRYSLWDLDHLSDAQSNITDEDRKFAETIRMDFASKLVLYVLKFGELSQFKSDLNTFLNTDFKSNEEYSTPGKYLGMCHKLPYFYEYNQEQLALFDNHSKKIVGPDKINDTRVVRFLKKLDPNTRKTSNNVEYWFEDKNLNRIVVSINKSNPLLKILDKTIIDQTLILTAVFSKKINYTVEYYSTYQWKLDI